jgi:hypothetical protein
MDLHAIDWDRLTDVLDLLLPHRFEAEREFRFNFLRHLAGNADAARVGKLLKPSGDVDAFAVPVGSLHDQFAKVDAHAYVEALVLGEAGIPFRHSALDVDGAFDRVDDARKLGEKAVPHQLED